MKDLKYLFAYVAPLAAFAGLYFQGYWAPGAIYVAFVMIPILELLMGEGSTANFTSEQEDSKVLSFFFDILLYLHLPIIFALVWYTFIIFSTRELSTFEYVFTILNTGLIVGGFGINVAHELGHRNTRYEQWMSKALLMTSLYMHFNIEHNRGHHKNIATDEDPASSKMGETLYAFWFRSVFGGYISAWRLENNRLKRMGKSPFNWNNEMIHFHLIQAAYLVVVGFFFGGAMVLVAIQIAVFGFLLLETVNYIEHYGLRRKKMENGRYETVKPIHSWNSNHELGRIFLYELSRHSDHHFKANRKYQVLRHFEEAPQMPYGYPAGMLMSLVPPLWFFVMNKRVKAIIS